ncbi:MAG TPA: alpha-amylase family glycosyl hydrolase, partial [Anaerolineaceae bacterium]
RALTNQAAGATQLEWYWKSRSASTPQERQAVDRIWKKMFRYQHDLPDIHGLMRELRALSDDYPGTMLVGETDMLSYYGTGQDELHMVFNFPLMQPDTLTAGSVALNQKQRLSAIPHGAWPGNTLGNHDTSRVASHFGDGLHNAAFSRLSLALMLTLKGTPFLYNGEEIGMTDLLLDNLDDFRDELGKWVYGIEVDEFGTSPATALAYAARAGRDKTRTPMQWADAPHAGFCPPQVQPWLPINPNYREGLNVQEQDGDPDSLLTFYRQLLRIRRQLPALRHGEYTPVSFADEGYLAFLRTSPEDHQSLLVLLNWSDQAFKISLDIGFQKARVKFSSLAVENSMEDLSSLEISPFEITIAELQP